MGRGGRREDSKRNIQNKLSFKMSSLLVGCVTIAKPNMCKGKYVWNRGGGGGTSQLSPRGHPAKITDKIQIPAESIEV